MVKAEAGAGFESPNLQSQIFLARLLCHISSDQLKALVFFLEDRD